MSFTEYDFMITIFWQSWSYYPLPMEVVSLRKYLTTFNRISLVCIHLSKN